MLKILQARHQQYINLELAHVQAGFRKTEEAEIKLPFLDHRNSKGFQKTVYFCFIDYAKVFDYVNHDNYGKFLKKLQ